MKNITKISALVLFISLLCSCTNEKNPVVSANGFELKKSEEVVSPPVLLDQDSDDLYAILDWSRSNNGPATESQYSLIISDHDADPNFSNAVESTAGLVLTPDARKDSLKVGDFNDLINRLPTFNCNQMTIDIRVKSKLGTSTNALIQYSNPVTVAVKGYPKAKPLLAFAQSPSDASTAPKLASSNYKTFTDYEGYMFLEAGSYKLYKPDGCGDFSTPLTYGLSGGLTGTLALDGSNGFQVTTPGFYLVKANITAGTYSISKFTTLGIFGTATGLSGFINTPMNYDATDKKFKLTFSLLKAKKFKFKLLNGTVAVSPLVVLGGTPDNCVENGADITVAGAATDVPDTQKYDIVLDVNNPRKYTYTLTINPN